MPDLQPPQPISLRTAALASAFALLGSVLTAPVAEMYALPKLIVPYDWAATAANVKANEGLFITAIFCYFFTFLCDIVLCWSLYRFLRPYNRDWAIMAGLSRFVYTILAMVALNNLVTSFRLFTTPEYSNLFEDKALYSLAMVYIRAFKNHWYFGLIIFGLHLLILGYASIKSGYVPKFIGILLLIAGLGYTLTSIRPYFFPSVSIDFAMYTFFGEIVFMLWLFIRGWKINVANR